MKKSLIAGIICLFTTILFPAFIIPAFSLEEFQSDEFGFSIKYPENWVVDDKIEEYEPEPGFDEGFFSIVYFFDDSNFSNDSIFFTDSIEVTFAKNDNIARNNHGQEYLERVEFRLTEFCETIIMEIDEYECSNFVVNDSEIFNHKGLPAYKFTNSWTERYSDGSVLDFKSILVDIVDGSNVWTIDGISRENEFQRFEPILEEVIDSFSIKQTAESSPIIQDEVDPTDLDEADAFLIHPFVIVGFGIVIIIGIITFFEMMKRRQQKREMPFAQFWKGLLPYQKWFLIGGVFMFPGIGIMRLSYNHDLGFGGIGLFGLLLTVIGIIIMLFVTLPLSIRDWRAGKTSFWGN